MLGRASEFSARNTNVNGKARRHKVSVVQVPSLETYAFLPPKAHTIFRARAHLGASCYSFHGILASKLSLQDFQCPFRTSRLRFGACVSGNIEHRQTSDHA